MIYEAFKSQLLALLKAPAAPPEPPAAGSAESVRTFRAAPSYLTFQVAMVLIGGALSLFVELVAMLVVHQIEGPVALAVGIPIMILTALSVAVRYFLVRLEYDMRYYIVTDRSVRIRQGIWVIHESTLTYANVQNLSVRQGPLERLLGISNLVIETAGGGGAAAMAQQQQAGLQGMLPHRGTFRGIANASEVRDIIQQLLRQYRDAGLGDTDDRSLAPTAREARTQASPEAIACLAEIRDELRDWRRSLPDRSVG